jgi:hypothetical protein
VKVLAPVNVNNPALDFTNEPAAVPPSAITPPNVPLLTVNAVPSNATNPVDAPFNVNTVTAAGARFTVPFAVRTAEVGMVADEANSNVAPLETVNAVDANEPPEMVNVPAFTVVAPVNVFTPLKVNAAEPTFTNEPATDPSEITPA